MYKIYKNLAELGFGVVWKDNIVKSTLKSLVRCIQLVLDFVLIPVRDSKTLIRQWKKAPVIDSNGMHQHSLIGDRAK